MTFIALNLSVIGFSRAVVPISVFYTRDVLLLHPYFLIDQQFSVNQNIML